MQWADVVADPTLKNLPYKIELNRYGQIIMTPHWPIHSEIQSVLLDELNRRLEHGRAVPEYAIQTSAGVRVADVVWRSNERWEEIRSVGAAPAPIAPELCIEVQSRSNTDMELVEKRALYFEAGALEVWICDETGQVQFYDSNGMLEHSQFVTSFPSCIKV